MVWAAGAVSGPSVAVGAPGAGPPAAVGGKATGAADAARAPLAASSARGPGAQLRAEASFAELRNARGGWDRTVVEPRYAVVQVERPPLRAVDLLLAERLVSTSHSDAEERESELAVTAWVSAKGRFDAKAWAFTDAADDGIAKDEREMFVATKHGCCGGEDVHDWYSLRTGRQAATATGEGVAFVTIPNTPTARIVAYHGVNGQRPPQTPSPIPQLLGVLTLGSHDGPLHRVALIAAGVDAWTPEVRLQVAGKKEESASVDLWAADKNPAASGIGGFRVKLTYEGRAVLSIPVVRDDFDLAHAVVPSPFRLQRLDQGSPPRP